MGISKNTLATERKIKVTKASNSLYHGEEVQER